MTDHQERQLLSDAEQTEQAARHIDQTKLNEAVRQGMTKGKKRAKQRRTFYQAGIVTAAAATVIALSASLMPGAQDAPISNPITAGIKSNLPIKPSPTPAKPGYLSIDDYRSVGMDIHFFEGIKKGYFQSIDAKQEKDSYTLTLKGAAMDNRKLYLVAELRNDSDQEVRLKNPWIDFGKQAPTSWVSSNADVVRPGEQKYFFIENKLQSDVNYPNQAVFSANVELHEDPFSGVNLPQTEFEIPVQFNSQDLLNQVETLKVDKELVIDGQRIEVQQVQLSPLGTYVDYRYADQNSQRIFDLDTPELKVNGSGQTKIPRSAQTHIPVFLQKDESSDGQRSLIFDALAERSKPDSIIFSIDGIATLDKEKLNMVVDTEKGEILSGGDGSVNISVDASQKTFTLEQDVGEYAEGDPLNTSPMMFEDTFVDAKGISHQWKGFERIETITKNNRLIVKRTLSLSDGDIAQPITLTINNYGKVYKEYAEIEWKP
ncbi:hypothetical protein [Saccharibacillus sp. JS10]|uniref:hypothetical protein n=1 Tax=Saccharibacillus sp. JS10 TaxID=2950552 RepID=UPI00210F0C25|nr:hypothetical protein [Saccharibacillus sp. JS10]MCQ4087411.1 hypothetical protein [Saccharibacillus sp. JS10]